jgi:hypothetical protein
MYLLIDHEIEPWAEDKEADRKNRDSLTAFAGLYPVRVFTHRFELEPTREVNLS